MSRVFTGLHVRKQIAGMDRGLFAVLISVSLYIIVFSPFPILVKIGMAAVAAFLYFWLRTQNKHEPDLVKVYIHYSRQADWYEPWPDWSPRRNFRPIGFGLNKTLK